MIKTILKKFSANEVKSELNKEFVKECMIILNGGASAELDEKLKTLMNSDKNLTKYEAIEILADLEAREQNTF